LADFFTMNTHHT